jgi:acetyl esterase
MSNIFRSFQFIQLLEKALRGIQMLDEPSQLLLAQFAQQGGPPFETLRIDVQRAAMDAMAGSDSPGPAIARVADLDATLPHATISVRLYHPAPGKTLPVLVYYHGGGWVSWSVKTHDPVCRRLCDAGQFAVVSVEYRLAPEHRYPAAVDDAYGVISWIRTNAEMLGIDPTRVGVAGDSAGGNLAAIVAHLMRDNGDEPLRLQALIYPVTDATMSHPSYVEHASDGTLSAATMRYFIESYVPANVDRRHPNISPLFLTDFSSLPPAVVVVAEYDPLRDDGFAYARRLQQAGVPVHVEHFANSMHAFISLGGLIGPETPQRAVTLIAAAFMQACA